MKKTFFKSVVATAVVTAAMALSSVVVFAADTTVLFDGTDKNNVVIGTNVTTYPEYSSDSKSTSGGTAFTARIKVSSEDTNYIKFSTSGNFTLNCYYRAGGSSSRNVLLKSSTDGDTYSTIDQLTAEYDSTDSTTKNYVYYGTLKATATTTDTMYYMLTASSEISYYYVEIVSSSPLSLDPTSVSIAPSGTANVTASINSSGEIGTVTWESANTSIATVEGNNTVATITGVANGETTVTATVTVDEVEYTKDVTVTVDDGSRKTVDSAIGKVTFTWDDYTTYIDDKQYLDDETVISDYFSINGSEVMGRYTNSTPYIVVNSSSTLQFETTVALDVTVNYCSTGTTNISYVNIMDEDGNAVAIRGSVYGSGSSAKDFTVTLEPGVYDIYAPASARGTRIASVTFSEASATSSTAKVATINDTVTNEYFVFFGVTESEAANSSFSVVDNNRNTITTDAESYDTVYKGVTINNYDSSAKTGFIDTYSIDALGLSSDCIYVYGFEVTLGEGNSLDNLDLELSFTE